MTYRPNLFLVGAPKCGTTSVHAYLSQHPNVFFSSHKEPHYFSHDLKWRYRGTQYGSENEYLEIFKGAGGKKWVGEASVWYLYSRVAAAEIAKFDANARIICMLRHPVDMMHSLYRFCHTRLAEPCDDFGTALAREETRQLNGPPKSFFLPDAAYYRTVATFSVQVENLLSHFPREHIHFCLFDDLRVDPGATCEAIFRFLDVDPTVTIDVTPKNVTDSLQLDGLSSYRRKFPRASHLVGSFLPRGIKVWLANNMRAVQRSAPTQMNPELRQTLMTEFDEEIRRLSILIERDLSSWRAPNLAND